MPLVQMRRFGASFRCRSHLQQLHELRLLECLSLLQCWLIKP